MTNFLRTPEARFERLPNYAFTPNYIEIDEMRMHFVDEGPRDADPILMMHGEPTWSYLYRHMIPICVAAGHRVIAPDLIGFGKSDKPTSTEDYSYAQHMRWMQKFIDKLELNNITLVCQDWGALLGLRLAAENESRFKAIVVGNGMLPTGEEQVPKAFKIWKAFALNSPWFPIARIVNSGSFKQLSKDEMRAYDAPFPSRKYKAGARAFPALVPVTPDNPASQANKDAWKILEKWDKPFLTTFSNGDPITRGGDRFMQKRVPGSVGQDHITLKGGHFLQEDSSAEFAAAVNKLLDKMAYQGSGQVSA
ncbi:haloalkane dehalogenase [Oleiphilus sp. HI0118]|uniref:haloalkane dehalogenase n=1 Tax=Oleiphilus sp. HI0079 TaxID=1822254 RepID=UPI0007C3BCEA|nr:haloalkane dehalogenase [Oleiphilus sp. HI0079]KZZ13835.1 haloalkane dehalogenase [Oleiphilus sp. HI0079]KZZ52527.1 haloalkane dehalogenase [Oleiphilus sp. HI0118]KZZ76137.1 haloalkane dehalogenase [Oleiphilus sp. HI0133]KZZ81439.1 haloalkane dehalogenase [Oleiphilus sp. HI0133]